VVGVDGVGELVGDDWDRFGDGWEVIIRVDTGKHFWFRSRVFFDHKQEGAVLTIMKSLILTRGVT
jgi:hypothetical protein